MSSNITSMNILVAEDQKTYQALIAEYLKELGINLVFANDGLEALTILNTYQEPFHAVLLDREMPKMNGIDTIRNIKQAPQFKELPIIFQTSLSKQEEIQEGLDEGAYYYLTKPYKKNLLCAIVNAAIKDYMNQINLRDIIKQHEQTLGLMNYAKYRFSKLDECNELAKTIAMACSQPEKRIMGLSELFINAVEHGNLGITYKEKSSLQENGKWYEEIERREKLPEYNKKYVQVIYEKTDENTTIKIKDQGNGFDWNQYMEISPDRAFDSHGRGIAMARMLSFNGLQYKGCGNEVHVSIQNV